MSKVNSGYQAVYSAALKALETDPYQEVAFSVATSQSACQSLAPEEDGGAIPALHLYLWNETLVRFLFTICIMFLVLKLKRIIAFFTSILTRMLFLIASFQRKKRSPPRDL
jgi:hypothetical protein